MSWRLPGRRISAAAAALAVAALILFAIHERYLSPLVLVVEDARKGDLILRRQVGPYDRLTLSYLHSVSKTRVRGIFEIAGDGGLIVRETSFGTFGPGLPELRAGDRYEIKEGAIHQLDVNQRLPEISVFVHPYTEHVLQFRDEAIDLSGKLAPGTLVRIAVESGG